MVGRKDGELLLLADRLLDLVMKVRLLLHYNHGLPGHLVKVGHLAVRLLCWLGRRPWWLSLGGHG